METLPSGLRPGDQKKSDDRTSDLAVGCQPPVSGVLGNSGDRVKNAGATVSRHAFRESFWYQVVVLFVKSIPFLNTNVKWLTGLSRKVKYGLPKTGVFLLRWCFQEVRHCCLFFDTSVVGFSFLWSVVWSLLLNTLILGGVSQIQVAGVLLGSRRVGRLHALCFRLEDWVRHLVHIPSYLSYFPAAHYSTQGYSSCLHPVPRPCNNSIASIGPHPGLMTNSAMCFMGRSINNAYRTSWVMIWCGSLTIWTM